MEKKLNRDLGNKPFSQKRTTYQSSEFELTNRLAIEAAWTKQEIQLRTSTLADLACQAWPSH